MKGKRAIKAAAEERLRAALIFGDTIPAIVEDETCFGPLCPEAQVAGHEAVEEYLSQFTVKLVRIKRNGAHNRRNRNE